MAFLTLASFTFSWAAILEAVRRSVASGMSRAYLTARTRRPFVGATDDREDGEDRRGHCSGVVGGVHHAGEPGPRGQARRAPAWPQGPGRAPRRADRDRARRPVGPRLPPRGRR